MSHLVFSQQERDLILNRMADFATQTEGKGIAVVILAAPTEDDEGTQYTADAFIYKATGIPAAEVVTTMDVFVEGYIHQCLASGELAQGFE